MSSLESLVLTQSQPVPGNPFFKCARELVLLLVFPPYLVILGIFFFLIFGINLNYYTEISPQTSHFFEQFLYVHLVFVGASDSILQVRLVPDAFTLKLFSCSVALICKAFKPVLEVPRQPLRRGFPLPF